MNENYRKKIFGNLVFCIWISLYVVLLFYCMRFFTWSDQYFYRLHYDSLEGRSLLGAYKLYPVALGAREPIYLIVTYIFQGMMSKHWFDICFNVSFLAVSFSFFYKSKLPKIVISFLLTNVYFLSIFFITERLKLGTMFLLLYFIFKDMRFGFVFILLAILSHAQLLIFLPFLFVFSNIKIDNRKTLILLTVFGAFGSFFLFNHLFFKLPLYLKSYSFFNIVKPLFFGLVAWMCTKKEHRKLYFSFFAPVILVALFFGDGRMTSLSFLGCLYFWTIEKKLNLASLVILLSSCYFSLRGGAFLLSAKFYGDGYALSLLDIWNNL